MNRLFIAMLFWFTGIGIAFAQPVQSSWDFYFGTKKQKGIALNADRNDLKEDGFALQGFCDSRKNDALLANGTTIWLKVPEGNYEIKLTVGSKEEATDISVRAESRRLMVYEHHTDVGQIETITMVVNVRSARIGENDSIRLKKREFEYLQWDEYLSLEFTGKHPVVQSINIRKIEKIPTIFLTGNSTVVDQDKEPWASWGQMFPVFLKPRVAVANFAESGETLKAFIGERRLKKVESLIQPGDYLFMEFAHNDQKAGRNHVEPFSDYQEHLMKFVEVARNHGATPVLVTSTCRRVFDNQGKLINTLEEYPEAMRELAAREHILLIDLNAMSQAVFEALGPEESKNAFVHYAAGTFPWQETALADDTHFSTYGAWQLAKCVIQRILDSENTLKTFVKDDFETYDPNKPDRYEDWEWVISENGSATKPDGY